MIGKKDLKNKTINIDQKPKHMVQLNNLPRYLFLFDKYSLSFLNKKDWVTIIVNPIEATISAKLTSI